VPHGTAKSAISFPRPAFAILSFNGNPAESGSRAELTDMAIRKLARTRGTRATKRKAQIVPMVRRRRTPDEARGEALTAARKLLLEQGPDAVTLQRVATELGMTHSNLLHHFGSAGELQSALMAMMVQDLRLALDHAVTHLRSEAGAPRQLVDMVFDAFDAGGAGKLAAWIALTGNVAHLESVEKAVSSLVRAVEEKFSQEQGDPHLGVTSAVLFLALMAFGDAIIGEPLKEMLERERAAPRKIAALLMPKFFELR
jgi:AcrR family transcriptional regulator